MDPSGLDPDAFERRALAELKKVASYRITYYEDEEPIGKR